MRKIVLFCLYIYSFSDDLPFFMNIYVFDILAFLNPRGNHWLVLEEQFRKPERMTTCKQTVKGKLLCSTRNSAGAL